MNVLSSISLVGELLLISMKAYNRYVDNKDEKRVREILEMQKNENAKLPKNRDMSLLDNLDYELMCISKEFLSAIERARSNVNLSE